MIDEPVRLIFERAPSGVPGRYIPGEGCTGRFDAELVSILGNGNLRDDPPDIPDLAEAEVVRHYTALANGRSI